jgi:hypothetical protein
MTATLMRKDKPEPTTEQKVAEEWLAGASTAHRRRHAGAEPAERSSSVTITAQARELIRDRCNGELPGEVRDPVPP